MPSRNLETKDMRLQEKYNKQIIPALVKKFGYKSPMAAPKVKKVVVNVGFGSMIAGKGAGDRGKIESHILKIMSEITGQMPSLIKAKKSIASFKLRQGMPIGAKATLRGRRMYEFLEKLIMVVLPRVRDFRGLPVKSVSDNGELTIGFKDFIPFPEIKVEREKGIFGLEITIAVTAKTKQEKLELLRQIGVPLKR